MSENPIQKIGRYEIEREIGRGGMAIVYKAFDPRLERPVAIKLIQTDAFATNAFGHVRERFEREAKALARLDHPNILKVYDYGEHNGAPYLVMDYIEGSTLKELKKPVRVDTAVKLLTPIADALEYVHAQGLLHRDVKPSNIMITQRGHVILTDFGIVKSLEDEGDLHTLTATGVGIGTPEYMSPEQGRGKQVDARSDMYSLSIVFYELITGRKPFTAETPVDILLKQISEPLPDPRQFGSEISESVKKFLDRAAAKDPEDRYPTTKEYLLDFQGLRLQAQTNRAMGQTSNSGFQSLPRKSESTASSLEIGKTDLAKVRAEADTGSRDVQPRTAPAKRIPWGALTFGLVLIMGIIWGFFGLQNRGKSSVAETREAVELAMMAVTAESAKMTAEAGKATFEVEAITATKAKEAQVMTGTAEREAQIATGTVGAEQTAEQATFAEHMVETARIETHEAAVTETQTAQTKARWEGLEATAAVVEGTKIWVDGPEEDRPTIWFRVYRRIGEEAEILIPNSAIVEIADGETKARWEGLEATDANGVPYTFSVREVDSLGKDSVPENYQKVEDGLTVTNMYVIPKKGSAVATIQWVNAPRDVPPVWFKLYRQIEGGTVEEVPDAILKQLNSTTTNVVWLDLEQTDRSGNPYVFSVQEVNAYGLSFVPDGYEKTENGLTVTNTKK